jgi:hypothetical protein
MRYVGLLFFGSFAVALLFLAFNRYQAAISYLAISDAVEGTVSSAVDDDTFKVTYRVGSKDYQVERPVPINHFPTIRVGDTVALRIIPDRPDAADFQHWSKVYQQALVSGFLGVMAMIAAIGSFLMMSFEGSPPPAVAVVTVLDHAIDLHSTWKEFLTGIVTSLIPLLFAFAMYRVTHYRWPWLSYIGAGCFCLLTCGLIWAAFFNKSLRIHADQEGIRVRDNDGTRQFAWKDVAALKRETTVRNVVDVRRDGTSTSSVQEMGHHFCLLDAFGKELLNLNEDAPMDPVSDWMLLRGYIRGRTGLPVKEEVKKSILGDSRNDF